MWIWHALSGPPFLVDVPVRPEAPCLANRGSFPLEGCDAALLWAGPVMGAVLSLFLPPASGGPVDRAGRHRTREASKARCRRPAVPRHSSRTDRSRRCWASRRSACRRPPGPASMAAASGGLRALPGVGRLDVQGRVVPATWLGGRGSTRAAAPIVWRRRSRDARPRDFRRMERQRARQRMGLGVLPLGRGRGRRADIALLRLPTLAIPKDREEASVRRCCRRAGWSGWPLPVGSARRRLGNCRAKGSADGGSPPRPSTVTVGAG